MRAERGRADKGERIRGEREVPTVQKETTFGERRERSSRATHTNINIYEYLLCVRMTTRPAHTLLKSACVHVCARANTSFSRKEDAAKAKDQP